MAHNLLSTKEFFKHEAELPAGADEAADNKKPYKVAKVPVSALVATQSSLDGDKVKKDAKGSKGNKPQVLKTEHGYEVIDGHHRIAGAVKAGKTNIKVRIYTQGQLH
jgi:ParB-like nuclease domain